MIPNTQIQKPLDQTQLLTPFVEPSSLIRERKEVLLGLFQENRNHTRHYEAVRVTVVSVTLGVAVGIVGVIASGQLKRGDWPLAVVLVVIGAFGAFFTSSYFKRISCYDQLADEFCDELDVVLGTNETSAKKELRTIKQIQSAARSKHQDKFDKWRQLPKVELFRMYWPLTISILAIVAMLLKFSFDWLL